jgi:hypothetical protein
VLWLRRPIAGLSKEMFGFDTRSDHVRFVVEKVPLGQVSLPVLQVSPVSIIPPMLHTHLHLHAALTTTTNGRSLGTLKQSNVLSDRWEIFSDVTTF